MARTANPKTRGSLMEAAFALARRQALAATGVDEICAAVTEPFFVAAPYLAPDDPLDRALGYIDLRGEMMAGEVCEFNCFAGTMAQEASATAPAVQAAVM
jgi:TetR/AcrR family transcriptional repressor of nem operon